MHPNTRLTGKHLVDFHRNNTLGLHNFSVTDRFTTVEQLCISQKVSAQPIIVLKTAIYVLNFPHDVDSRNYRKHMFCWFEKFSTT